MKKEITVGQLISAAIGIIIAILTAWVTLKEDVATIRRENQLQDVRIDGVEIETKANHNELRQDIRQLQNTTNDIKVLLERKQDRK